MNPFTLVLFICALLINVSSATAASEIDRLAQWDAESAEVVDHSIFAGFLSDYVETAEDGVNRVRYEAVSPTDRQRLDEYIETLAAKDPIQLNRSEAFAYWVNLYNALTVQLILEHYPVKSIREIKPNPFASGPWRMELVTVSGISLTLDDIEHGILRAQWRDARIHYAVNCASISCPNLLNHPYTGAELNTMLDGAAQAYVNHPRGVRVKGKGKLILSSIYKWYAGDFGGDEQGVINHLLKYAGPALAAELRDAQSIDGYEYDWSLNEAR
ncbi:DUF547 domain-containing protein [Hyphococcus sp.]|uniref:DUF547 domain-containing protein n=1 Tax=Hyphococcus sp. TaxID=2038636 RepID=UPI00208010E2|nr:MAG: DUF547 domain-containing protein [Marinicaulis sp.]